MPALIMGVGIVEKDRDATHHALSRGIEFPEAVKCRHLFLPYCLTAYVLECLGALSLRDGQALIASRYDDSDKPHDRLLSALRREIRISFPPSPDPQLSESLLL